MPKVTAISLRPGNVIEHKDRLWVVVKNDEVHPGKGNSVSQVELRDIRAGNKDNVRFRTQETVERVRLEQEDFQYLYEEGDDFVFMNNSTYEQIHIAKDMLGKQAPFLQESMVCMIETYDGEPLRIELPSTVILEITEAEPVIKGQTATTSYKPAILENGVRVMVPPHVEMGTRIVVKTEDASYVERAKD